MQKVSFSFPAEVIDQLDHERGMLSRNQFVLQLLRRALREHQESTLHRITAEVYGDREFAEEEERLAEAFFKAAPEAER
jgi:metal-responsive CopG/Arc/MetJ family transcriptional regulator